MSDLVINIISSASVSSALAIIILFVTKSWIAARLKSSIQHEYDQKLETHKAQLKADQEVAIIELRSTIEKEASIQRAAHDSFQQVQKAAIEKKMSGIDKLWESVITAKNETPAIITFLDVLLVEEFSTITSNPRMKTMAAELNNEKMSAIANSMGQDVEKTRPYVGEYLWALFYAYRVLTIRTLVLIQLGMTGIKKLNWYEDSGIKQLIASVFSEKQIKYFDSQKFGKFGILRNNLELLMLKAMNKIVSGEEFSNDTLLQSEIIMRQAQDLVQNKP